MTTSPDRIKQFIDRDYQFTVCPLIPGYGLYMVHFVRIEDLPDMGLLVQILRDFLPNRELLADDVFRLLRTHENPRARTLATFITSPIYPLFLTRDLSSALLNDQIDHRLAQYDDPALSQLLHDLTDELFARMVDFPTTRWFDKMSVDLFARHTAYIAGQA